jgi:hypothetical protein
MLLADAACMRGLSGARPAAAASVRANEPDALPAEAAAAAAAVADAPDACASGDSASAERSPLMRMLAEAFHFGSYLMPSVRARDAESGAARRRTRSRPSAHTETKCTL